MHLTSSSLLLLSALAPVCVLAANASCTVTSGPGITPVIELYTSEGCSSCPPADQWLSTLKGKPIVAQAFHVAYWDYIGWKDPFAQAAFSVRQREIAAINALRTIYTPQLVRNGRDWPDWRSASYSFDSNATAKVSIALQRTTGLDGFEAKVTPLDAEGAWTAYWTVTEDGHNSRVKAGENAGAFLKHDFVVRQYTPVGRYQGAQVLKFFAIAAQAEHPRRINLVVSSAQTGEPLQGVSLSCL